MEHLSVNFLADKREERFKKGLWQFMIDHAKILPNGNYQIHIGTKSASDLWRRVEARIDGNYKTYELEERNNQKELNEYYKRINGEKRFTEKCKKIRKSNNPIPKIILYVYNKCGDYIYKK